MSSNPSDLVAQRADALLLLVESRLPVDVNAPGAAQAWPLVGPALLAHATRTLHSIILLAGVDAHNDAFRLLRSLYDHVLTLAWLAADPDPPTRLEQWRLEDLENRLKADREASAAGEPLLEAPVRAQWEAESPPRPRRRRTLHRKRSLPTDTGGRGSGVDISKARLLQRPVHDSVRNYSGLVHATFRGLNRVTEDLPDGRKRVVLQAPLDAHRPDGIATVLHGLGLYVAAQSLGWPTAENVTAVFDRYPGP